MNANTIRLKLSGIARRQKEIERNIAEINPAAGKIVREKRLDARLKYRHLHERTGISITHLWNLEQGCASWDVETFNRVLAAIEQGAA